MKTENPITKTIGNNGLPAPTSPLKLTKLEIKLNQWGEDKGLYTAQVTYDGKKGAITMNVSPELTHDLLRFCGGAIKRFSEAAALELDHSITASIESAENRAALG